tara:strand:- start:6493 stop:7386 length:894 start_codon:yes stop_codon:yes gene_type:complete
MPSHVQSDPAPGTINNPPHPSVAADNPASGPSQATKDLSQPHTTGSAATTQPANSPPVQTPIIAGAAAGGTALLALAIGTVLYILRRRKHSRTQPASSTSWDPSKGMHGKPTLPDVEGHGGMRGGGDDVKEMHSDSLPDRYAGLNTRALNKPPVIAQRQGNEGYGVGSETADSAEYQELEARSPTLTSARTAPALAQTDNMSSWHALSSDAERRGVSEVHGESVSIGPGLGGPVSELGSPWVRSSGTGGEGVVELGSESAVSPMVGVGDELRVELDAGQTSQPRYCGGGGAGVAQNF